MIFEYISSGLSDAVCQVSPQAARDEFQRSGQFGARRPSAAEKRCWPPTIVEPTTTATTIGRYSPIARSNPATAKHVARRFHADSRRRRHRTNHHIRLAPVSPFIMIMIDYYDYYYY